MYNKGVEIGRAMQAVRVYVNEKLNVPLKGLSFVAAFELYSKQYNLPKAERGLKKIALDIYENNFLNTPENIPAPYFKLGDGGALFSEPTKIQVANKEVKSVTIRTAKNKMYNFVEKELGRDISKLDFGMATMIFAQHYNLEIFGSVSNWLGNLYADKFNRHLFYVTNKYVKIKAPKKKGKRRKTNLEKRLEERLLKFGTSHPLSYLFNKPYADFLKSQYWYDVRTAVLERDKNKCRCGSLFNLQVHHTTYDNHFDEINHIEDLITLCSSCHKKEHGMK